MLPERIGPYRVTRLIGQGGMGFVYEAVQEPIARRVAVKVLRPEFAVNRGLVERFFNEARTVNVIEHPNIVQITDFGQAEGGTVYIAMEYLRGENLEQRLHRLGGRLPVPETLYIAQQVTEALSAAHAKGIVHRDLKPDNIMLVPDSSAQGGERIKLLDFGIAKLLSTGTAGATLTQQVLGTPTYMSPEQCRGAGKVDERTDVYSLGVILYRLLAGRAPFVSQGPGEIIAMHLREEPPPLSGLSPETPPDFVKLVHRLLIKDRELRPPLREVLGELELLQSGLLFEGSLIELTAPTDVTTETPLPPSSSTISRSGWQARPKWRLRPELSIGLGILVALAALTGYGLLLMRTSKTTVPPHAAAVPTPTPPIQEPRPVIPDPVLTQLPMQPEPSTAKVGKPAPRKPAVKPAPSPSPPSPPKKPAEVTYVD